MTLHEAVMVLGVAAGDDRAAVRALYLALMRQHHPDVADGVARPRSTDSPTEISAALVTEAYSVLAAVLESSPDGCVPPIIADGGIIPSDGDLQLHFELDGDTIFIEAPPDEAYQRLLDSAVRLGGIGHVDRNLGLLEVIVRFDGGPSCSVLMTLQGRAYGTDVFVEMESIEADPTPPIDPVLNALVELLASGH